MTNRNLTIEAIKNNIEKNMSEFAVELLEKGGNPFQLPTFESDGFGELTLGENLDDNLFLDLIPSTVSIDTKHKKTVATSQIETSTLARKGVSNEIEEKLAVLKKSIYKANK